MSDQVGARAVLWAALAHLAEQRGWIHIKDWADRRAWQRLRRDRARRDGGRR